MAIQELDQHEQQIHADYLTCLALIIDLEGEVVVDPELIERGVSPLAAAAIAEGIETHVIWDTNEHEIFNAGQ